MVTQQETSRMSFIDAGTQKEQKSFAEAIKEGFRKSPKKTPPRFLYDERGSELFTKITKTDDYYVTDLERKLLNRYSHEIIESVGSSVVLTEPGAGDCAKSRILIDSALEHQSNLHFEPIDISEAQLKKSSNELLDEYNQLEITAVAGRYEDGLQALDAVEDPRLVMFLGSSIGNYSHKEAVDLLSEFAEFMDAKDRLLIGVDLLKSRPILEAAYDDSDGVTADFNKNLLRRINRELGGEFDLEQFEHQAPFVEDKSRIEMRLVSTTDQEVFVRMLGKSYEFEENEYIHTESSHKFTVESFTELANRAGLTMESLWTDEKDYFAQILFQAD